MTTFRYRDRGSSKAGLFFTVVAGALAGFAVGVLVAQKAGGFSGIADRLRGRRVDATDADEEYGDEFGEEDELESESDDFVAEGEDLGDEAYELEERVLEAFRNDPILCERAVDIGAIGIATIELTGWVNDEGEANHAVVVARGVPGVDTVVNRVDLGADAERFADASRRFEEGDPTLTEAHWEGQQVGTGRRRQGTSEEPDRHADPRVELEDRWLSKDEALRAAAEETEGVAERRARAKKAPKGDRAGGSPVTPTGVPKADHVANPDAEGGSVGGETRAD
jgi:BON domain-containing protein